MNIVAPGKQQALLLVRHQQIHIDYRHQGRGKQKQRFRQAAGGVYARFQHDALYGLNRLLQS